LRKKKNLKKFLISTTSIKFQDFLKMSFSFEERVNAKYCNILAKISFKQFKQFYSASELQQDGNEMELTTQFNLLRNYCQSMIKNGYKRVSTYGYAGNKTEGRIYLKDTTMGLQRIWNKFRGVLSDGITRDLDMVNAHPTILANLCSQHGIISSNLNIYINARKEIFDKLKESDGILKDDAKFLFLKSINDSNTTDKFNKKRIKSKEFLEFDKEMKHVQSRLCSLHPELYKECQKTKSTNPEGSLVNLLLCKIENELLQKVIKHITQLYGFQVSVPMYDGLMFFINEKVKETDTEFIRKLNLLTNDVGIKWAFKQHNCDIKEILDNMQVDDNVNFFIGETEQDVANYCIDNIFDKKLLKCQKEVYVYDNLIWTKDDTSNIIARELGKHDLYIQMSKGDKLISKDTKGQDSLTKLIMRNVKVDNDFIENSYLDTLYKICFENGFYNFKDGIFHKYTKDNIPLTTRLNNRVYTTDKSKYNDIFTKILYPTFNIKFDEKGVIQDYINLQRLQYMKFILHKLARMTAGHIESKEWMMLLGDRNSGKGIITLLFELGFTSYITSTLSANFVATKKMGGTDTSKLYSWMDKFDFSRICFINEIANSVDSQGNHEVKFDSEIIKKLTSGGDKIQCRNNFTNERSFHIQCSFVMCCNDEPIFTSNDAKDYLVKFEMPCRFLTDETYNSMSDKNKTQFIRQVADQTIKTQFCRDNSVIDSFINLIFEAYTWNIECPELIRNEQMQDERETDYSTVLDLFNKTECEDDKLTTNEIYEACKAKKIPFTKDKICKILHKAAFPRFRTSTTRGFTNISL